MGNEAIVYGRILGATWNVGDRFRCMYDLNREALSAVPEDDDWPWVVRDIFALPAPYPQGTYRRQVIHFGLSIKDDPYDRILWDEWLGKFEQVLRRLYWWSAAAHIETDFGPPRTIEWAPTEAAMGRLYDDPPQPVSEWVRSDRLPASRDEG
ncbi:hypothetical protein [Paludisphaera mucosa]|uniref:Uncharacterized protein n=1 Tax=Paludisphaera mucosa TaxID=3030827 RepID=A0ABT6F9W2_9BACT|nr:hypothetical protein [Paludisphaera mucosa]MDG3004387.1 hypothetical protein [Paludisphaera mucosa]